MNEQKKSSQEFERINHNYKEINYKNDYTTEYIGTGVSYLGDGRFSIPKFSYEAGKFSQGTEEVSLDDDKEKYRCKTAILHALNSWVYTQLSMNEMRVLNFIVNRTILFFKTYEIIPLAHFLKGVEGVCSGSGISDKGNLSRAISKLKQRGLIRHQENGRVVRKGKASYGPVFMIEFNNINEWVKNNIGGQMKKTNILPFEHEKAHYDFEFDPSEMYEGVVKKTTQPLSKKQRPVVKKTTLNRVIQKGDLMGSPNSVAVPSETAAIVDSSFKERTTQVSSTKESQRRETVLSKENAYLKDPEGERDRVSVPKAIEYFTLLAKEKYPGRIFRSPTGKICGMLKNMILSVDFPEGDILDFLGFVVLKWDTIRVQHFEFINRGRESRGQSEIIYPEFPDLGFMCQFKTNFLSAYQKENNSKLSAVDLYADRLRAKGLSEERVSELSQEKIAADCDYQKSRVDYYKGLDNLKEERVLLDLQRKTAQREVQEARKSVYILKSEADKEAKRLASLRATEMPQKSISSIEPVQVETDPTDWNGMSEIAMKNLSQEWVEKFIPDFAFWTEELYEAIFAFEFQNHKGDMSFVYNSLKSADGSYYDRREDLRQYDREYAILEARGDEAGIHDLKRSYRDELVPGFKRFE